MEGQEQPEVYGVKESLEVIAGVKVVGVNIAGALSDGKINLADAKYAVELAKSGDVIVAAVKGSDLVLKEAKDLDQQELIQLGMAAYDMVKSVVAASKAE